MYWIETFLGFCVPEPVCVFPLFLTSNAKCCLGNCLVIFEVNFYSRFVVQTQIMTVAEARVHLS